MNRNARVIIFCLFAAAATAAATSKPSLHLTPQRVLELTAPTNAPAFKSYRVTISDLGQITLPSTTPEGQIALFQEAVFPTDFDPPQPIRAGGFLAVTPIVLTKFDKLETGWTVRLKVKPQGKLLSVSGVADCVEANLVPAGYGAVAGPIYVDQSDTVLTKNIMNMAKVQTTTTRFQIFAVPGEAYDVTLYRGAKAEIHHVRISAE